MVNIRITSPLKIFLVSFLAMTIAMATLAYAIYQACYDILAKDLGLRAQFSAQVAASIIEVDQELVKEMMGIDIVTARNHIAAMEFKRKVEPLLKRNDIKYIYVETKLPGNQIRYFVSPEEEKIFGQPPGTPMEYFYVLTSEDESGYRNRDRFDVADPLRERTYVERVPTYGPSAQSKWGTVITGYQPIFDHNNQFIGLLGVDIAGDQFDRSVLYVKNIVIMSFGIIVLLGGIILFQASKILSKPLYIDELTKLFNREYMKIRLDREISRARRNKLALSLLMLDLDYFKSINDCFGHQTGDLVLKKISELICVSLREEDIVFRYGGEEIAILLPETGLHEAKVVAERIRQAIETSSLYVNHHELPIHATISIGIAELVAEDTQETLIKKADDALYLAKEKGRNCCQCGGESE